MSTPSPTETIVVEYELPRSPDKVWRALTEPELLAAWLMPNDIRPNVGHSFTFKTQAVAGWDGTVHCEVLEAVPHRLLRYSWRGGSDTLEGYGSKLDTVLTFTLTATAGGGTHLRLEHAGFTQKNAYAFENIGKGWRGKVAERIDQVLSRLVDAPAA